MTEFPLKVRAEAARRVNAEGRLTWTAEDIIEGQVGIALCQAVMDGCLHLDPDELDRARAEVVLAGGYTPGLDRSPYDRYRRLVREGWTPPEPVDPVLAMCRELGWWSADDTQPFAAALAKLRLKIVPEDGE
jgi:hypothetical protein